MRPEYGIYTTIIAGILISLFGGSRFQIGGPTGAFVPILFGIVITYGFENLLIAGFLAGIILFLMGLFKLGSLIKFIPKPVTVGFTSGIAVIIFVGQILNFLGLSEVENHEKFFDNIKEILNHVHSINIYSVITAVICLGAVIVSPKIIRRLPGPLFGLILSTFPKILVFRMGNVPFIDTTGESYLRSIVNHFNKNGMILVTGIKPEVKRVLMKTGLYDIIKEEHFFLHTGDAINYALMNLDQKKCYGCKQFAFRECVSLSERIPITLEIEKELTSNSTS